MLNGLYLLFRVAVGTMAVRSEALFFPKQFLHLRTEIFAPGIQLIEQGQCGASEFGERILRMGRQFGIDLLLYQAEVGKFLQL